MLKYHIFLQFCNDRPSVRSVG